jgi:hypothetical protein
MYLPPPEYSRVADPPDTSDAAYEQRRVRARQERATSAKPWPSVDLRDRRAGEVALVDGSSRVASCGAAFLDTLLDENAACHVALGNAYVFTAQDSCASLINRSSIHVDLVFGDPASTPPASPATERTCSCCRAVCGACERRAAGAAR